METTKVALKDYKPNLIPEAIGVTMEEFDLTRDEAIELLTELSYKLDHPKKKKKVAKRRVSMLP